MRPEPDRDTDQKFSTPTQTEPASQRWLFSQPNGAHVAVPATWPGKEKRGRYRHASDPASRRRIYRRPSLPPRLSHVPMRCARPGPLAHSPSFLFSLRWICVENHREGSGKPRSVPAPIFFFPE